ncbi:MAG: hypothetical protein M1834_009257 [Cirrosporium novae-zelandiae]|nr:MAG: hypothetical protein M1834_009257 [Cirrosporium novae-zelandiae]
MSGIKPPFTAETALKKVKAAQALWNTQNPQKIALAYTETSIWRNRDQFFTGRDAIITFLTKKWEREKSYRLRKELFSFHDNKIAVQFWYEFRDASDGMKWKRCYGLEDWTFDGDGRMRKRQMSGNNVEIGEGGRWFTDEVEDVDTVDISEEHW